MPKQLIPVRLEPETVEQLDQIVAASVGERSDHLRQAVSEYIARHGATPPVQVSHHVSPLSTEDETDHAEPAFVESPLRVA